MVRTPCRRGSGAPAPGTQLLGSWWYLVPPRGCWLGRAGSPSAYQQVPGGRNSPGLDLFGRAHHTHEFLMPAGKGHHQFPYRISLPSPPCFQEGGQEPLTAGKKGGPGPGLGLKRRPGTPQSPHPNGGSHGVLGPGFGTHRPARAGQSI